jgi:hypothetical protein
VLTGESSVKASIVGPQEKPIKDVAARSLRIDLFELCWGVCCTKEKAGGDEVDDWNKAEKAKAAEFDSCC